MMAILLGESWVLFEHLPAEVPAICRLIEEMRGYEDWAILDPDAGEIIPNAF
jgi:hypothetical protein